MTEEQGGIELGGFGVSVKHVGLLLGLVFVAVLAVVIGKQMSTEAMAVVVGIVCGVAAGIPTSVLLLVVLTRRERQQFAEAEQRARHGSYPPVVVIQGGTQQGLPAGPQAGYWPSSAPTATIQRHFHLVGGDEKQIDD